MGELLQKRNARADKAFTDEERTEFQKLNEELIPLSKEQETLQLIEKAATETEAYLQGQKAAGSGGGSGLPHPRQLRQRLKT
jgi:hypothetical protein